LGYEEILVLTPLAGAFSRRAGALIHSGKALADGTVRGSSSRLLVEFLQERYEQYAHKQYKFYKTSRKETQITKNEARKSNY